MYHTYILFSSKLNRYYTGQTEDLERRVAEHNRGKTAGMAGGIPLKLIYSKDFISRSEAMKLEKFIKKRGAFRFLLDNNISSGG
jgi:putative endonuclease